jgi:RNA-directed DNA polymerase
MIEKILSGKNIRSALKQVLSNQGSAGVDGMRVHTLPLHLKTNWKGIITATCNESYHPQAILGVEIAKSNERHAS